MPLYAAAVQLPDLGPFSRLVSVMTDIDGERLTQIVQDGNG